MSSITPTTLYIFVKVINYFFHNLDKRRKKTGETKDAAAKLKKEEIKEASVKRAKLKEKQEALRMKRENKKKAKPVKKEIEGG